MIAVVMSVEHVPDRLISGFLDRWNYLPRAQGKFASTKKT
jgi:hypothetical protein